MAYSEEVQRWVTSPAKHPPGFKQQQEYEWEKAELKRRRQGREAAQAVKDATQSVRHAVIRNSNNVTINNHSGNSHGKTTYIMGANPGNFIVPPQSAKKPPPDQIRATLITAGAGIITALIGAAVFLITHDSTVSVTPPAVPAAAVSSASTASTHP